MTNLCAVLWQHVNTKQEIHTAKQMRVWTVLTKSDCSMFILALNFIMHDSMWLFPLEQYKKPTQSPQVAHVIFINAKIEAIFILSIFLFPPLITICLSAVILFACLFIPAHIHN